MENALIKSLIDALEASALTELEYSKDGVTLRLVKGTGSTPPAVAPRAPASQRSPAPTVAAPAATPSSVTAPVFGVVHLRRTPADPPLVAVGQVVSAGQVLCLIEAMKVFTELRAEHDGTIGAVLVESGQEVDAGQALFRWA